MKTNKSLTNKESESYLNSDDFISVESINFVKPLDYEDIHFIKDGKEWSINELVKEHNILELIKKYSIKDNSGYYIETHKMNEAELKVIDALIEENNYEKI